MKGKIGPEGNPGNKGERGPPGPPGLPTLYLWRNTAEEWAAFQVHYTLWLTKIRFSKFTSEEASDPRAYLLSVLHVRMMDSHLLEETMREIYLLVVCGLLLYIVGTYLQSLPKRPLDDKVRKKKTQKCCNNRDQWRKDVEFYVVLSFGEFSVCRLLAANQFLPVTPCRLACKYARMLNNIVVTIYFGFFFLFSKLHWPCFYCEFLD